MKKLIIAAFMVAGISFASQAQTNSFVAGNRIATTDIGKHKAKKAVKKQPNTTTSMTTNTTGAAKTTPAVKKHIAKKAPVKTSTPNKKAQ